MEPNELLTACRAAGVTMKSRHNGRIIGWTTDEEAAGQLRAVDGVMVLAGFNSTVPSGWEVSVPVELP